ncbi:hypothetical protein Ancab_040031 [Ancistrocladus abbreviatus]
MGAMVDGRWKWIWDWRRPLFVWEHDLLSELAVKLDEFQFNALGDDVWTWKAESSGCYTVKSAYSLIRGFRTAQPVQSLSRVWTRLLPGKVSAFLWRALLDRIPSRANLYKRNIDIKINCSRCQAVMEDTQHVLLDCPFAYNVWLLHAQWWKMITVFDKEWSCLLWLSGNNWPRSWRKLWLVTSAAVAWSLWKERNNFIFNDLTFSETIVFDKIQAIAFEWIKARGAGQACSFSRWQADPKCMWK